jgi:hypothetical protein
MLSSTTGSAWHDRIQGRTQETELRLAEGPIWQSVTGTQRSMFGERPA